jgi:hypothetical protein
MAESDSVIVLLTTVPPDERGPAIARALVEERLAACVNLNGAREQLGRAINLAQVGGQLRQRLFDGHIVDGPSRQIGNGRIVVVEKRSDLRTGTSAQGQHRRLTHRCGRVPLKFRQRGGVSQAEQRHETAVDQEAVCSRILTEAFPAPARCQPVGPAGRR